ncbi:MAG: transcription termination/antitermination protein NusA [Elusimicrobiales bacterium]|nr:transcription termination/antitermination protein NusA [Elusimicrobiales bacterium]
MEENQKSELLLALERLERERNIKKEEVFKTIEDALVSALRKHIGKNAQISAKMDPETGGMSASQRVKVVETVASPELEITPAAALARKVTAEIGQEIDIPLDINEFSRIAAQIAKQVLIQKIRDIERDNLYREYKPREGEVITGMVRRFSDRDIIVDVGKAEAILPYCEQIRKERYAPNSRVKAVILRVLSQKDLAMSDDPMMARYRSAVSRMDKTQRGPYIILSRAAPLFLTKLFEVEVPEITDHLVEMVSVERDPGFRAKVVVRSSDLKVDPIGACVGMRGMRIRAVTNELSGERIDLIVWSSDPVQMIANAMSPSRVTSVRVQDKEAKRALVVVPDDQLAVAIGKDWQNIKLASKITGWELEAKSEIQVQDENRRVQAAATQDLTGIEGIGPKTAEVLIKAGLTDISRLASFTPEHLATLQGVGEKTAVKIIQGARKYLQDKGMPLPEQPAAKPAEDSSNAVEGATQEIQNDNSETVQAEKAGEKIN